MGKLEKWAKDRKRSITNNSKGAADGGKILKTIQAEAKANGATLAQGGKGGVNPKIALDLFRKAKWRCENKHCPTPKQNITLDHISGHPKEIAADPEAVGRADLKKGIAMGHVNEEDALHVLCEKCHTGPKGSVHARENQIEAGKKPTPMRGSA
jgi:hypothetical protein